MGGVYRSELECLPRGAGAGPFATRQGIAKTSGRGAHGSRQGVLSEGEIIVESDRFAARVPSERTNGLSRGLSSEPADPLMHLPSASDDPARRKVRRFQDSAVPRQLDECSEGNAAGSPPGAPR
jgi:hypothetical protein